MEEEKVLLLKGISKLQSELDSNKSSLETIERLLNLVDCLVLLNWREVGKRITDIK
jgi:hypothetical protein